MQCLVSNLLDTVGRDHLEAKKGQVQLPGEVFNFLLRSFINRILINNTR